MFRPGDLGELVLELARCEVLARAYRSQARQELPLFLQDQ